ncbi:MAG: hypothetical protein KatS3mg020_1048 [Fimbriimonadales bacterium]|nr:MAG: hypothetical protein KatS3mg019_2178 [Fimbriimonadales bacterium]GIV11557.1 MAG: hypothetical protein KatS3mg020_1048 [Fimbriimonadales bacterium]
MSELMVLLQALLLIAGWLLFLRAQTELRAQAARQSLTGELEELRQTVDALLQKLVEEAAQAEARLETRWREFEMRSRNIPPAQRHTAQGVDTPDTPSIGQGQDTHAPPPETFIPDSGYNLSVPETSLYGAVAMLAEQGLSVPEIARQTGYAPGEVELILNLKRRSTEENG